MDVHAVYLGQNDSVSACPARALGTTEAIQVEPLTGHDTSGLQPTTVDGQPALENTAAEQAVSHRIIAALPNTNVLVTISFGADASPAREILAGFTQTGPSTATAAPRQAPNVAATTTGSVLYTGKGFDTCGAPSESQMSAWRSSYGAVGIYIGGANRACPDGNLSATWVQDEVAAGWKLVPIYVGLQASCNTGFETITPNQAAAQGTAAADDAVSRAASFGIGTGNPIYFDMEGWNTDDSSCTTSVVNFVKAWTTEIAKKGYESGFYGSANAGIAQAIAPLYGKSGGPSYLYFAQWDKQANTSSSYFPATAWPGHQRIKQYNPNLTETHGGVKLSIDQDYVDGVVVGDPPQPTVTKVSPTSNAVGTTVTISGQGFVPGDTTVEFGGAAARTVTVTNGQSLVASVPARSLTAVDVTVSTAGGTSAVTSADRFTYRPLIGAAVDPKTQGYWLTTPQGNIYHYNAPFYGSTATKALPAPVVAIAADPKTGGYWLVTAKGNVYNFNAPFYGSMATKTLPSPVVAIAADPKTGGYWLVTAKGNVYNFNAPFYGSTATKTLPAPIAGITADPKTGGYWLTTTKGNIYNFNAPFYGSTASQALPAPVTTIMNSGAGYLLTTSAGNIYHYAANWYGSPASVG